MFQILMVQSSEPVKRKFPSRAMQEMASLWQNQILCPIGSGHVSCASSSRSSLLNHVGAVVLGPSVADYNRSFDTLTHAEKSAQRGAVRKMWREI